MTILLSPHEVEALRLAALYRRLDTACNETEAERIARRAGESRIDLGAVPSGGVKTGYGSLGGGSYRKRSMLPGDYE